MEAVAALPDYLTDHQVAGWLGTTTSKVRKWAKSGFLPAIALPDGSYLFDPAALATWAQTLPRTNHLGPRPEVAHAS